MRARPILVLAGLGLIGAPPIASADDAPAAQPDAAEGRRAPDRTAEEIEDAPRPHEASGHRVPPGEPAPATTPLRGLRLVPRLLVRGVLAPVRLALWTEDRYAVSARAEELFWSEDRTRGVYPVASWDGGRSLSAGAAAVDRDVGGGTAELRATAGTSERVSVAASAGTGRLLGRWRLEGSARYRDVANASFYGYGDADEVAAPPPMPVDPTAGDLAFDSRFGIRETLTRAGAAWTLGPRIVLSAGGSLRWIEFAQPRALIGDAPVPIAEVYRTDVLPDYQSGVEAARGEVAVFVDRRQRRHRLQSTAAPSHGVATQLYAGWQQGLGPDATRFGYGGADTLALVDLYGGDRVLAVRVTVDGVVGDLSEIPFVELPTLGGPDLLRGYPSSRFRDRWSAAASIEYRWPVTDGVMSFLFVDTGRVARTPTAIADELPRATAGAGLQLHGKRSMLARIWIATTDDGGVLASVKLDSLFGTRPREKVP
jgi:hypothetical protein